LIRLHAEPGEMRRAVAYRALAAGQRHYCTTSSADCAGAGTIVVTILFGPINYFGANPKLTCH
jgi:hypothetical protein